MGNKKLFEVKDEYPFKNSPTALCFEAEIKRMAEDREEPIAHIVAKLAQLSGVSERHIYNYRSGKSEIPVSAIQGFCEQFDSIALGIAWLSTFGVTKGEVELLDLTRLASRHVRSTLQNGEVIIAAMEDGKVTGFEMNEIELAGAKIHRDTAALTEVARGIYERGRAA